METITVGLTSTKSLGRPNKLNLSLSKQYPTAKFAVISQTINEDWVTINYNGFEGTNNSIVRTTYHNWYESTLSGAVFVSIFGN